MGDVLQFSEAFRARAPRAPPPADECESDIYWLADRLGLRDEHGNVREPPRDDGPPSDTPLG